MAVQGICTEDATRTDLALLTTLAGFIAVTDTYRVQNVIKTTRYLFMATNRCLHTVIATFCLIVTVCVAGFHDDLGVPAKAVGLFGGSLRSVQQAGPFGPYYP